jgi:hypothetical protein
VLIAVDLTRVARAPVHTVADPIHAALILVTRAVALTHAGRLPMLTGVAQTRAVLDLVLIADDLTRVEPAPPVSVEVVILVAVNPALRGARQGLAERDPGETVQIPTRAEPGPGVPTVVDPSHAARRPVLIVADPTRVAAVPVVLMLIAVLTAARLVFIALARRLIRKSLPLARRSLTLKASNQTLSPRVPTLTMMGMILISRVTTFTTGSRIHTSRVPASITMLRLTRITRVLARIATRQPLAEPTRKLVQQNFARVGPRPLLGAAAAPVAPMPRANAYRRYCRVRASHRVARRRTGFAPAALPSTANPQCSALACRIRINFASMAG